MSNDLHRDFDREFAEHERRLQRDANRRAFVNLVLFVFYLIVGGAAVFILLTLARLQGWL